MKLSHYILYVFDLIERSKDLQHWSTFISELFILFTTIIAK